MYNAVIEFLRAFVNSTTATSLFPALAAKFALLITLVGKLVELRDQQTQPIDGKIEDRESAFTDLTQATVEVADSVLSYARSKRNHDLAARVRGVRTELRKLRVGERTVIAERVHAAAAPLAAELLAYGVTAAELEELRDKIDATVQAVKAPVQAKAVKKVSTSELSRVFADIDDLLAEIDPMLTKLQSIDLATYERYLAARAVFARPGTRQDASGVQSAAEPTSAPAPATAERPAA
jgi:hypothetical protein